MFMHEQYQQVEERVPGLIDELKSKNLEELESGDSTVLTELLRKYKTAGLIIPEEQKGLGMSATEMIDLMQVVGSFSPSLAVLMTMHHHTVATFVAIVDILPNSEMLLESIARDQLMVASAFAEGKENKDIFDSTLLVSSAEDGFKINGSKKPCSMSNSMDIIVAGVGYSDSTGVKRSGVAIISGSEEGIERKQFWKSDILKAADSNEVVFNDVFVTSQMMLLASESDSEEYAQAVSLAELTGICWFQLLVSASYLGVASGLANRVIKSGKGDFSQLSQIGIELEGAKSTLLGVAGLIERGQFNNDTVAKMLFARFSVQHAIIRATDIATEVLGGINFSQSSDIAYLLAASRGICFHPISRNGANPIMSGFMTDGGKNVEL
jgi:alkylation response protein AidB-like acyl-CoA dehydrogenase